MPTNQGDRPLKQKPEDQRFEGQDDKAAREQPAAPDIDFASLEQLARLGHGRGDHGLQQGGID